MNDATKKELVFLGVKYFPSKGGTSRVVENLIRQLKNKFSITLFCFQTEEEVPLEYESVNVIQLKSRSSNFGVFWYYLLSTIKVLKNVDKSAIIHVHKTDAAFVIPLLKLKFKRLIITSHEAPYLRDKWNSFGKLFFKISERIFIYSNVIITSISYPLSIYYQEKYKKKVTFIPNGVSINQKTDISAAEAFLNDYKINGDYLLFAARRIMATKGLHTLLEAVRLKKIKMPVVILGEIEHAESYVKGLREEYAEVDFRFCGFVKDLTTLLGLAKKSKLFVFPSETEGMSIMLLEIVSSKVPIVCSDIPENKQVFNDSEVVYFKNKNAEDLGDKLLWSIKNSDAILKIMERGYDRIEKEYTWDNIATQYVDLYSKM